MKTFIFIIIIFKKHLKFGTKLKKSKQDSAQTTFCGPPTSARYEIWPNFQNGFDIPGLNNTYFTFEEKFYQQIFGVPMGFSISVPIANLVMEHIEIKAINFF